MRCCRAGPSLKRYGHMGLRHFLQAEHFDAKFRGAPVAAQFSSMGSLTANWMREFSDSLSAGRVAGANATGELPLMCVIVRLASP